MSELSDKTPIEDKSIPTEELLTDDDFQLVDDEADVDDKKEEDKEDLLKEDKPEKKVKAKKEEDEDEDEEKEIELEDDEDVINKGEPVFPVPVKVITAKYPNLFKDFPHLKVAMFRDKEYTEMFGTVDEAKEALESKQRLDNIQNDIFDGKLEDILSEVKNVNQNAFNKVVDNYLPALMKTDQTAYLTVISNVGKGIISELYNSGKQAGNKEFEAAAIVLHQFLFPGMGYQPPQRLSKDEPKPDASVEQQKQQLATEQFNNAFGEVSGKITNTLKSTVDAHIDPKGQMSAYEKRNAIKAVLDDLDEQIGSDSYFRPYYDKLWTNAARNGYKPADREAIIKAYKARARTLLTGSITKIRNEVLKTSKASNDDKDRQGPIRPGRSSSSGSDKSKSNSNPSEKAKTIPKGMSTLDYLNSDD